MTSVTRIIVPAAAAAALIATSGILHAVQSGSWGRAERLAKAASRLKSIPLDVPGWRGTERGIDAREMRSAEAAGVLARTYTSAAGATVETMLLCGPSGPIAVHPPTVCFTGAGYQQLTPQTRVTVTDRDGRLIGTFWTADFEYAGDGLPVRIRTYWSWSDGNGWTAPDTARFAFAGVPVLHKVYVTSLIPPRAGQSGSAAPSETIGAFIRSFLPDADRIIFSSRA